MTAALLDGKKLAETVRAEVRAGVDAFRAEHGRAPGLDVVLVGEDPASQVYTRNKEKASIEVGMRGRLHRLPATTTEAELLALLEQLNADDAVDGILVQLPLPRQISEQKVLDTVRADKDVDGFHPINVGLLASGRPLLVPCTPVGCMRLLASSGVDLKGARAVVVGRSNIVGKPIAQLLLAEHATVTIAHSRTRDLPAVCREAEILVAAVGRPEMVKGDWIKPGATVIDVGINRVPTPDGKGRIVGDVATAEAMDRAAFITPVPGGVGRMTVACLLQNTVVAAEGRAERSRTDTSA
jgi:methylenetetrahydrofolate dehydrogenase (NADP+)/methenyltetrahydrofolate cyclohydrolase